MAVIKKILTMIRTYSELIKIVSFADRFEYLKLQGVVGQRTFGDDRYLNQHFYKSREWLLAKNKVIVRDHGCDLGVLGYDINSECTIIVHHMNPLTKYDLLNATKFLLDPEYLITMSHSTHQAITFGYTGETSNPFRDRSENDTSPWIKNRR